MRRRPFLIFMSVMGLLVAGTIAFIQSRAFAPVLKKFASRYIPGDIGVHVDFTELRVKLFPPGVSILKPRIDLQENNVTQLPPDSRIVAERVDLLFSTFQIFSGSIRIQRVVIVDGEVNVHLDRAWLARSRKRSQRKGVSLKWEDLFKIQAEAVALENTRVKLKLDDPDVTLDLLARDLALSQTSRVTNPGYEVTVDLRDVQGKFPRDWSVPPALESITAHASIGAQGAVIHQLTLTAGGLSARVAGKMSGDILNPTNLMSEATVEVSADLSSFVREASGRLLFNGAMRANPIRLMETLRADGKFTVRDARFKEWTADLVDGDGSWVSTAGGGEIAVSRVVINQAEQERQGGAVPAKGGRLEVGAFRWRFGSTDPVSVKLKLDSAHIHWLAAVAPKAVWPLDFRASGTVDATFTPPKGKKAWELVAQLGLTMPKFQLDNQRMGKTRPLHKVLEIPALALAGGVRVDPTAIRLNGITLSLPRTQALVGGEIDFKKGYDLRGDIKTDLRDLGQIAENEIRGTGEIRAHVHGPAERVFLDFDTDLDEAYYLRLKLGQFKGRITWDDDPSRLLFSNVEMRRGRTAYRGAGSIDLGDQEAIAMSIDVNKGQLEEFTQIFSDMTADLWWFPKSIVGTMDAKIQISGQPDLDAMMINSTLNATNVEYAGERFKTMTLVGGYDKGRYYAESFTGLKRQGSVSGKISFDVQERFDWDFRTDHFTVTDIDNVARLDLPIRGKLSITSRGRGKSGEIEAATRIAFTEASIRGVPVQASELSLRSQAGVTAAQGIAIGGQGILDASYDFKPGGPSYVRATLRSLDFSPILLLLNPKTIQDRELKGVVSGVIDMAFRSGEADLGSGKLELSEYLLAKTGTRFELVRPVSVKVDRGTFNVDGLAIRGRQGESRLTLSSRGGRIEGAIRGEVDTSIAEFLTSAISRSEGVAKLDIDMGGSLKEPVVFGKATFAGSSLRLESFESPFENITGSLELRQNVVTVQGVEADLANGRMLGGGTITVFPDRYPKLALTGELTGNRIKVYPFQFAKVRGKLKIHGEQVPYTVDGDIVVESALSREKVLNQSQARGLKSARFMPTQSIRREGGYPLFKLNIGVVADRGVMVQNDLFDAEMKGRLTLVNTIETPRILGSAEMIQGKMSFKDRVFQVQSANINFDNPTVINPLFNLTATTDVGGSKIQVYASGRMDKYKIELSSNPAMAEADILSLLALGMTSSDVRKMSSGDRDIFERGEAASLLLHSLDFNRDVQSRTGFEIQLDETVNTQSGSSITRRSSDADPTSSPKIVIKRRLGKRVDLSAGATVGVGGTSQKEVNAEIRVTPGFSVIGVYDNTESVLTPKQESFGVDLKLQKRFK